MQYKSNLLFKQTFYYIQMLMKILIWLFVLLFTCYCRNFSPVYKKPIIQNYNPRASDSIFSKRKTSINEQQQPQRQKILPNRGYSSDRQQMSSINCYNGRITSIMNITTTNSFNIGKNTNQLEKELGIDLGANKINNFLCGQDDQLVCVLQKPRVKNSNFLINYLVKIDGSISVQYGFGPASVLTPIGMKSYKNGSNTDFGLECGDKIISTYKSGAILIISLNILFPTINQKRKFDSLFGTSDKEFNNTAKKIIDILRTSFSNRSLLIEGYQRGGSPHLLEQLFFGSNNRKSQKQFSFNPEQTAILGVCGTFEDTKNWQQCVQLINKLNDYAMNRFTNQISLDGQKGFSIFPVAFASFRDLKDVGLMTPKSTITAQIETIRGKLVKDFLSSYYYQQKLGFIWSPYWYAVQIKNATFNSFFQQLNQLYNDSDQLLTCYYLEPVKCFDDPKQCRQTDLKLSEKYSMFKENLINSEFLKKLKLCLVFLNNTIFYPAGYDENGYFSYLPASKQQIGNVSGQILVNYEADIPYAMYEIQIYWNNPPNPQLIYTLFKSQQPNFIQVSPQSLIFKPTKARYEEYQGQTGEIMIQLNSTLNNYYFEVV